MLKIGPHEIWPPLVLAPMAGITDKPTRVLCRRFGAGYAVSEMLASDPKLRFSEKSRSRRDHSGEPGPIGVQIAGADPAMLADAARYNVDQGADIIDINMGCPAKKVLKAQAGSALLADELLVGRILDAVVGAVNVPVTLKIRTGTTATNRNGVRIAGIAEAAGVAALAVHGRTRDQRFDGEAEYATIASIKQAVSIPVIANGDMLNPVNATEVLAKTGADGLMIGRGALGKPWVFREIAAVLFGEAPTAAPAGDEFAEVVIGHVEGIHQHYGEHKGVRIARKHIGWYLETHPGGPEWRRIINRVECPDEQIALLKQCIGALNGPDSLPRLRGDSTLRDSQCVS